MRVSELGKGGRLRVSACATAFGLCLLFASCASSPPPEDPPPSGAEWSVAPHHHQDGHLGWIESRAYLQANYARKRAGLGELEMRLDLMDAARAHAADMADRGYFSHFSPEGSGPGDRADRMGIRFAALAENLARVRHSTDPAAMAVHGWLKSPGHRRNLLDEGAAGYRFTGIGVARGGDGSIYLAQVFLK